MYTNLYKMCQEIIGYVNQCYLINKQKKTETLRSKVRRKKYICILSKFYSGQSKLSRNFRGNFNRNFPQASQIGSCIALNWDFKNIQNILKQIIQIKKNLRVIKQFSCTNYKGLWFLCGTLKYVSIKLRFQYFAKVNCSYSLNRVKFWHHISK